MEDEFNSIKINIINLSQYTNELIGFIQDYWQNIVPRSIYEKTVPENILIQQENTLIINTSWPIWAQEIEWNKTEIIEKLNKSFNILQFRIDAVKSKIISDKELAIKIKQREKKKQSLTEDKKFTEQAGLMSNSSLKNRGEVSEEIAKKIHSITDERMRKSLMELAKYLK